MNGFSDSAPTESPRRDGPPSQSGENAQLQWLIQSVSQLKVSHESLSGKVDHRLECLEIKFDSRNEKYDAKIDARHISTEQKIATNHELLISKLENLEGKIQNTIATSKIAGIKWAIGLAFGLPSAAWMIIQIVKAFTATT